MSVRARETTASPFPFSLRSHGAEAAEAARRRMDDPAYRVEADRRRGRGAPPIRPGASSRPRGRPSTTAGTSRRASRTSPTEVIVEKPRTIIARNDSPDIGFDRSINPYRGCEHGCAYCFARPSHAFQGLSPGPRFRDQDLRQAECAGTAGEGVAAPRATSRGPSRSGPNTDPYQPVERRFRITRQILEVLDRTNHPVGIVTKSALVTRDIDILRQMADRQLAKVAISVTTLDPKLARRMEPRAASPGEAARDRPQALGGRHSGDAFSSRRSSRRSTSTRSRRILKAAYAAGAREAGYVLLRLPHDLKDLMRDWLAEHYPDKLNHVFSLSAGGRGGKDYDSDWGERQTGVGPFAWMIGRRFETATARLGFNRGRMQAAHRSVRAAGEG